MKGECRECGQHLLLNAKGRLPRHDAFRGKCKGSNQRPK